MTTAKRWRPKENASNVERNRCRENAGRRSAARNRTEGEEAGEGREAREEGKPGKKPAANSGAERTNKKAEVIAMMKRAKGATLAEIVKATGWQKHTVLGFVSILGSKGGQKIDSSKNAAGERTYKIAK